MSGSTLGNVLHPRYNLVDDGPLRSRNGDLPPFRAEDHRLVFEEDVLNVLPKPPGEIKLFHGLDMPASFSVTGSGAGVGDDQSPVRVFGAH